MIRFLKLVHLEVQRFQYVLFGLMSLTAVIQIIGLVHAAQIRVNHWIEAARLENQTPRNFSFADIIGDSQFLFTIPILISITVLGLYVFLIWYRDWIGRDKFAYRVFTLPTARWNIYIAKATAIFLFVFALVAFQVLLLLLERQLFNWMVPSEYRISSLFAEAVASNLVFNQILLPQDGMQFVVYYGVGILAVCVIFTAILLERSYRWTGVVYAILYVAACGTVIGFAVHLNAYSSFYPREITAIRLVVYLAALGITLALGFRLVSKKITV
ncbi:hypothetical protein MKZ07_07145 [Paenibacillus sp. FSL P4-0338]|uniref:hypothetical protein n=1 Tax=unclassified Paenibacillus TaxID=185978 RepID=UPI0003E21983|nr:hypothetical protein [Paenibacillus sp. FSL R7-269]ETT56235.1 hypothetical protein C162_02292 [Paenibacillus sp. FSL R7-269]